MQIHLRGLHGFVPKPERNHGPVDAMTQELHGGAVSQHVRRDLFPFQRGTPLSSRARVAGDEPLDGISAERPATDRRKDRIAGRSPGRVSATTARAR